MRSLLDAGADPRAADPDVGWPIAQVAVNAADAEALVLLKTFGADIELADETGATALARVASSTDDSDSVIALLVAGADPNVVDQRGWTPLHRAAVHGLPTKRRSTDQGRCRPGSGHLWRADGRRPGIGGRALRHLNV